MRITLKPEAHGTFAVDGETLHPGESAEVANERGEYLLSRHAALLTASRSDPKESGTVELEAKTFAQPTSGTAPADPKE